MDGLSQKDAYIYIYIYIHKWQELLQTQILLGQKPTSTNKHELHILFFFMISDHMVWKHCPQ